MKRICGEWRSIRSGMGPVIDDMVTGKWNMDRQDTHRGSH